MYMTRDAVWAVIVARVGNGAKSRLAAALDAEQRRRLALAMLSDVLAACGRARHVLSGVVAVVDDPHARQLADSAGALVVDDPGSGDMNAAAAAGLRAARQWGARTAIVLPGDVPLISSHDLEALIDAAGPSERVVIVGASRDGQGTNALLLRPPHVIVPSFGPPSVNRHSRMGDEADAHVRTLEQLGLALDVDTPADLAALADAPVGPHTAEVLADLLRAREQSLIRF
jgi:2-phospho-L-lactate guanylyltransferase